MMPIGPLMIEHRLIERMIRVLGLEVERIEKEKQSNPLFIPIMGYFSKEEKDAMLQEGYGFDRRLIHERYRDLIGSLEKAREK